MKIIITLIAIVLLSPFAYAQDEEKATVELTHWWVSPGEKRALSHLESSLSKQGAKVETSFLKNFNEHRKRILEQISLDYMPAVTHWLGGNELKSLQQQSILRIPELSNSDKKLKDLLYPEVLNEVMIGDTLSALPVGVHLWNYAYYNAEIYRDLGLKPPTNWNDLFAHVKKIKAAGYTPIATGTDTWQLSFIFDSILLSQIGLEDFQKIYQSSGDISHLKAPLRKALETFLQLKPYTSAELGENSWFKQTQSVANGEAAIQFMGDFALGELSAMAKIPGEDFHCLPAPGTYDFLFYGVDVFALLKVKESDLKAGQKLLVDTVMDPAVQTEYIRRKGGLPVRKDLEKEAFSSCTQEMLTRWTDTSTKRIPLPAGNNRLRMSTVHNAASEAWQADEPNLKNIVENVISSLNSIK